MGRKITRINSMGFATVWVVVALVITVSLATGVWWLSSNNQNTQSQLDSNSLNSLKFMEIYYG
jgi:cell division protein FtsX